MFIRIKGGALGSGIGIHDCQISYPKPETLQRQPSRGNEW